MESSKFRFRSVWLCLGDKLLFISVLLISGISGVNADFSNGSIIGAVLGTFFATLAFCGFLGALLFFAIKHRKKRQTFDTKKRQRRSTDDPEGAFAVGYDSGEKILPVLSESSMKTIPLEAISSEVVIAPSGDGQGCGFTVGKSSSGKIWVDDVDNEGPAAGKLSKGEIITAVTIDTDGMAVEHITSLLEIAALYRNKLHIAKDIETTQLEINETPSGAVEKFQVEAQMEPNPTLDRTDELKDSDSTNSIHSASEPHVAVDLHHGEAWGPDVKFTQDLASPHVNVNDDTEVNLLSSGELNGTFELNSRGESLKSDREEDMELICEDVGNEESAHRRKRQPAQKNLHEFGANVAINNESRLADENIELPEFELQGRDMNAKVSTMDVELPRMNMEPSIEGDIEAISIHAPQKHVAAIDLADVIDLADADSNSNRLRANVDVPASVLSPKIGVVDGNTEGCESLDDPTISPLTGSEIRISTDFPHIPRTMQLDVPETNAEVELNTLDHRHEFDQEQDFELDVENRSSGDNINLRPITLLNDQINSGQDSLDLLSYESGQAVRYADINGEVDGTVALPAFLVESHREAQPVEIELNPEPFEMDTNLVSNETVNLGGFKIPDDSDGLDIANNNDSMNVDLVPSLHDDFKITTGSDFEIEKAELQVQGPKIANVEQANLKGGVPASASVAVRTPKPELNLNVSEVSVQKPETSATANIKSPKVGFGSKLKGLFHPGKKSPKDDKKNKKDGAGLQLKAQSLGVATSMPTDQATGTFLAEDALNPGSQAIPLELCQTPASVHTEIGHPSADAELGHPSAGVHVKIDHPPAGIHPEIGHLPACINEEIDHPFGGVRAEFGHPSAGVSAEIDHPSGGIHPEIGHLPAGVSAEIDYPSSDIHAEIGHAPADIHPKISHIPAGVHAEIDHPSGGVHAEFDHSSAGGVHVEIDHPPAGIHPEIGHLPAGVHAEIDHPSGGVHAKFGHPSAGVHVELDHPPAGIHAEIGHPSGGVYTEIGHPPADIHAEIGHPPSIVPMKIGHLPAEIDHLSGDVNAEIGDPSAGVHTKFGHQSAGLHAEIQDAVIMDKGFEIQFEPRENTSECVVGKRERLPMQSGINISVEHQDNLEYALNQENLNDAPIDSQVPDIDRNDFADKVEAKIDRHIAKDEDLIEPTDSIIDAGLPKLVVSQDLDFSGSSVTSAIDNRPADHLALLGTQIEQNASLAVPKIDLMSPPLDLSATTPEHSLLNPLHSSPVPAAATEIKAVEVDLPRKKKGLFPFGLGKKKKSAKKEDKFSLETEAKVNLKGESMSYKTVYNDSQVSLEPVSAKTVDGDVLPAVNVSLDSDHRHVDIKPTRIISGNGIVNFDPPEVTSDDGALLAVSILTKEVDTDLSIPTAEVKTNLTIPTTKINAYSSTPTGEVLTEDRVGADIYEEDVMCKSPMQGLEIITQEINATPEAFVQNQARAEEELKVDESCRFQSGDVNFPEHYNGLHEREAPDLVDKPDLPDCSLLESSLETERLSEINQQPEITIRDNENLSVIPSGSSELNQNIKISEASKDELRLQLTEQPKEGNLPHISSVELLTTPVATLKSENELPLLPLQTDKPTESMNLGLPAKDTVAQVEIPPQHSKKKGLFHISFGKKNKMPKELKKAAVKGTVDTQNVTITNATDKLPAKPTPQIESDLKLDVVLPDVRTSYEPNDVNKTLSVTPDITACLSNGDAEVNQLSLVDVGELQTLTENPVESFNLATAQFSATSNDASRIERLEEVEATPAETILHMRDSVQLDVHPREDLPQLLYPLQSDNNSDEIQPEMLTQELPDVPFSDLELSEQHLIQHQTAAVGPLTLHSDSELNSNVKFDAAEVSDLFSITPAPHVQIDESTIPVAEKVSLPAMVDNTSTITTTEPHLDLKLVDAAVSVEKINGRDPELSLSSPSMAPPVEAEAVYTLNMPELNLLTPAMGSSTDLDTHSKLQTNQHVRFADEESPKKKGLFNFKFGKKSKSPKAEKVPLKMKTSSHEKSPEVAKNLEAPRLDVGHKSPSGKYQLSSPSVEARVSTETTVDISTGNTNTVTFTTAVDAPVTETNTVPSELITPQLIVEEQNETELDMSSPRADISVREVELQKPDNNLVLEASDASVHYSDGNVSPDFQLSTTDLTPNQLLAHDMAMRDYSVSGVQKEKALPQIKVAPELDLGVSDPKLKSSSKKKSKSVHGASDHVKIPPNEAATTSKKTGFFHLKIGKKSKPVKMSEEISTDLKAGNISDLAQGAGSVEFASGMETAVKVDTISRDGDLVIELNNKNEEAAITDKQPENDNVERYVDVPGLAQHDEIAVYPAVEVTEMESSPQLHDLPLQPSSQEIISEVVIPNYYQEPSLNVSPELNAATNLDESSMSDQIIFGAPSLHLENDSTEGSQKINDFKYNLSENNNELSFSTPRLQDTFSTGAVHGVQTPETQPSNVAAMDNSAVQEALFSASLEADNYFEESAAPRLHESAVTVVQTAAAPCVEITLPVSAPSNSVGAVEHSKAIAVSERPKIAAQSEVEIVTTSVKGTPEKHHKKGFKGKMKGFFNTKDEKKDKKAKTAEAHADLAVTEKPAAVLEMKSTAVDTEVRSSIDKGVQIQSSASAREHEVDTLPKHMLPDVQTGDITLTGGITSMSSLPVAQELQLASDFVSSNRVADMPMIAIDTTAPAHMPNDSQLHISSPILPQVDTKPIIEWEIDTHSSIDPSAKREDQEERIKEEMSLLLSSSARNDSIKDDLSMHRNLNAASQLPSVVGNVEAVDNISIESKDMTQFEQNVGLQLSLPGQESLPTLSIESQSQAQSEIKTSAHVLNPERSKLLESNMSDVNSGKSPAYATENQRTVETLMPFNNQIVIDAENRSGFVDSPIISAVDTSRPSQVLVQHAGHTDSFIGATQTLQAPRGLPQLETISNSFQSNGIPIKKPQSLDSSAQAVELFPAPAVTVGKDSDVAKADHNSELFFFGMDDDKQKSWHDEVLENYDKRQRDIDDKWRERGSSGKNVVAGKRKDDATDNFADIDKSFTNQNGDGTSEEDGSSTEDLQPFFFGMDENRTELDEVGDNGYHMTTHKLNNGGGSPVISSQTEVRPSVTANSDITERRNAPISSFHASVSSDLNATKIASSPSNRRKISPDEVVDYENVDISRLRIEPLTALDYDDEDERQQTSMLKIDLKVDSTNELRTSHKPSIKVVRSRDISAQQTDSDKNNNWANDTTNS